MKKSRVILILLIGFSLMGSSFLLAGEKEDFAIAEKAYEKGFFREAVSYLEQFVTDYPGSKKEDYCYLILGISELKLKRPEQAAVRFQKILSSFPKSNYQEITFYYLAVSLYEAEEFKEADKKFREFLEKYPDSQYAKFIRYNLVLSSLYSANLYLTNLYIQL